MNVQSPSNLSHLATGSGITPGYMSGFGNGFETEALPGALPVGRNSPQKCPYGLYAEQLSGSPFTAPRTTNERTWLYRIRPTVANWGRFHKVEAPLWRTGPALEAETPLAPLRWDPIAIPAEPLSFIEGIRTMTTAGDAGCAGGDGRAPLLSPPARCKMSISTTQTPRCWSCRSRAACALLPSSG